MGKKHGVSYNFGWNDISIMSYKHGKFHGKIISCYYENGVLMRYMATFINDNFVMKKGPYVILE